MFFEQTPVFQEGYSKNFFREVLSVCRTLLSHRTDNYFEETLSSPRTRRYPLSNRYFVNRSRWLLSTIFLTTKKKLIYFLL